MNTKQSSMIEASVEKIQKCKTTLEKIASTCCLPIRSKKMLDTFKGLDKISNQLKTATKESISSCVEEIEGCGSQLGKLYVSCCTEKREALYQRIFKLLNEAHTNIHQILGATH